MTRPIHAAFTGALLLLLAGCGDATQQEPARGEAAHDVDGEHAEEVAMKLDAAAIAQAGIAFVTLSPSSPGEEIRAPGEVVDNAYGTTLITPRVESIVVRRQARLGDDVAADAPLVTLTSVEVAQAQGSLRLAEQDWARVRALGKDAVSGRRYNEAQVAVEQARATARAYGVGAPARGAPSGEFTLRAPHAGRITEDAFVEGERIEPGRALFRLVDESVVWVDAKLPAASAQRVVSGSPARVVLGKVLLEGTVVQRAHRTSEDTRNALVRVEVANIDDRLHSGDYVEVYLDASGATRGAPVLAVPSAALVQLGGESVVFRAGPGGEIAPVEVRTGDVVGDQTILLEGVADGDRIVVAGAFALKARMLKAQLGEGHAH